MKWYFNELLGYLIMSFTSIPVIENDNNKPECIFLLLKCFHVETATKRKPNDSVFKSYDFKKKLYVSNVYNRS